MAAFTPYTPLRLNRNKPVLDDIFQTEVYSEYDDVSTEEVDADKPKASHHDPQNVLGLPSSSAAANPPSYQTAVPTEQPRSTQTPDKASVSPTNLSLYSTAVPTEQPRFKPEKASVSPTTPLSDQNTPPKSIESSASHGTVPDAYATISSSSAAIASPSQANKAQNLEVQKAIEARRLKAAEAVANSAIQKIRARQAFRTTISKHVKEQDDLRKERLKTRGQARDKVAKDTCFKKTTRVMRASNPRSSLSRLPDPLPFLKNYAAATKPDTEVTNLTTDTDAMDTEPYSTEQQSGISTSQISPPNDGGHVSSVEQGHITSINTDTMDIDIALIVIKQKPHDSSSPKRARDGDELFTAHSPKSQKLEHLETMDIDDIDYKQDTSIPSKSPAVVSDAMDIDAIAGGQYPSISSIRKRTRDDKYDELATEHRVKSPRLTGHFTPKQGLKRSRSYRGDELAAEHRTKNPRLDDEIADAESNEDGEPADTEPDDTAGPDENAGPHENAGPRENLRSRENTRPRENARAGENPRARENPRVRENAGPEENAEPDEAAEPDENVGAAVERPHQHAEPGIVVFEDNDPVVVDSAKIFDPGLAESKTDVQPVITKYTNSDVGRPVGTSTDNVTISTPLLVSSATESRPERTYVIYHSTGVQTTIIRDANTFRRCYGRGPSILRNNEIGAGGRGRFTPENHKDRDVSEFRYGMAFLVPSSSPSSNTPTSQGFQTMDFTEADPALIQARYQAQIDANKLSPAAWAQGVVVSVKKDGLLSHSPAIQSSVKVHGDGTVNYLWDVNLPMLFPNLAFELPPHDLKINVVNFTSPLPSPSTFAEHGNAASPNLDAAFAASTEEWEVKAKATVMTEQRQGKEKRREKKMPSPPTTTAPTKKR